MDQEVCYMIYLRAYFPALCLGAIANSQGIGYFGYLTPLVSAPVKGKILILVLVNDRYIKETVSKAHIAID